jgi:uncharacterized repeat protein (TIGR03803 family)
MRLICYVVTCSLMSALMGVMGSSPLQVSARMRLPSTARVSNGETIYNFGAPNDGSIPAGDLLIDRDGNAFGTTVESNSANGGTIFELSPPAPGKRRWTESVLYTFPANVAAIGVTASADGDLYGVTGDGGPNNDGYAFRLHRHAGRWNATVLYAFTGQADGGDPSGRLLPDGHGGFFGTASEGGSGSSCGVSGCGTVLELRPPSGGGTKWIETVLHAFSEFEGDGPGGRLTVDSRGDLFGTTLLGGSANDGTVYELIPQHGTSGWKASVIHAFTGRHGDGALPVAGLLGSPSGVLYGTTSAGGSSNAGGQGTVFSLSPPTKQGGAWKEAILHAFQVDHGDGLVPYGDLVADAAGALYGTTEIGGGGCVGACGTVFKLTPPQSGGKWTIRVLVRFDGQNGEQPRAGLTPGLGGTLYGTTSRGGSNDGGTAYAVSP